jgi:pimeloyl-ACP methyl ester carboxylesterase
VKRAAPLILGIAAVVLAAVVVFAVVRPGPGPGPGSTNEPSSPATSPTASPRPDVGIEEPLPLGTIAPDSFPEGDPCPEGHECRRFSVACPGLREEARVGIAVAEPRGTPRGVVALFSGGGGREWWVDEGSTASFVEDLRDAGLGIVQIRWKDEWLGAASGEQAGPHRLACRSATVIRWIHDEVYAPLGVSAPGPGRCGFCLSGSSGGASQITYALAFYGIADLVDVLAPTGGPPHAALAQGCLRDPDEQAYWYEGSSVQTIDASWGFRGGGGPCVSHDAGFRPRWLEASVELGGNDYAYPETRVRVIIGQHDRIQSHARDYVERLRRGGTDVELEIVPGMGHAIASSPDGLEVLRRILVA